MKLFLTVLSIVIVAGSASARSLCPPKHRCGVTPIVLEGQTTEEPFYQGIKYENVLELPFEVTANVDESTGLPSLVCRGSYSFPTTHGGSGSVPYINMPVTFSMSDLTSSALSGFEKVYLSNYLTSVSAPNQDNNTLWPFSYINGNQPYWKNFCQDLDNGKAVYTVTDASAAIIIKYYARKNLKTDKYETCDYRLRLETYVDLSLDNKHPWELKGFGGGKPFSGGKFAITDPSECTRQAIVDDLTQSLVK